MDEDHHNNNYYARTTNNNNNNKFAQLNGWVQSALVFEGPVGESTKPNATAAQQLDRDLFRICHQDQIP